MPYVKVGRENSADIELHYQDHGTGPAVILIHGWPLSGSSWEKQTPALLQAGYRVIAYDRRGFGKSSQPAFGYDADTLANDLDALIKHLQVERAAFVGFSMGGCELARYAGLHGSAKMSQVVFISAVTPYLRKASDNPEGVDPKAFADIQENLLKDRPAFMTEFFKMFYNVQLVGGTSISDEALRLSWNVASMASPIGTHATVATWGTDFRKDLQKITCPTLIIHGSADKTVPFEASGKRMKQFVKDSRLVVLDDAPHGVLWTHADKVNAELLGFLNQTQSTKSREPAITH